MRALRIGDICVGQNFINDAEYNGEECTVIDFRPVNAVVPKTGEVRYGFFYIVKWCNGEVSAQERHTLRLKDQPTPEAEQEYNALIERLTDLTTV